MPINEGWERVLRRLFIGIASLAFWLAVQPQAVAQSIDETRQSIRELAATAIECDFPESGLVASPAEVGFAAWSMVFRTTIRSFDEAGTQPQFVSRTRLAIPWGGVSAIDVRAGTRVDVSSDAAGQSQLIQVTFRCRENPAINDNGCMAFSENIVAVSTGEEIAQNAQLAEAVAVMCFASDGQRIAAELEALFSHMIELYRRERRLGEL